MAGILRWLSERHDQRLRESSLRHPRMDTIVHISADFPDDIVSKKTRAVRNLVTASREFRHLVFSLNRSANPSNERIIRKGDVTSMVYWGLPSGLFLQAFMERAANRIIQILEAERVFVSAVHAHKLTFEGLVGTHIANRFGVPLIVTLRGSTDCRVLKAKPHRRGDYRDIVESSACLFYAAPWTKRRATELLSLDLERHAVLLPNIVRVEGARRPSPITSRRFVSVFNLMGFKGKNFARLANAVSSLAANGYPVYLDVLGTGTETEQRAVRQIVERTGYPGHFRLLGGLSHAQVLDLLPDYIAMVLPSYPETFGLVYIEALACGVPVLHAIDAGIDGFFLDGTVGRRVKHRCTGSIADALIDLFENQAAYKARVHDAKRAGQLDLFREDRVVDTYERTVHRAIQSHSLRLGALYLPRK